MWILSTWLLWVKKVYMSHSLKVIFLSVIACLSACLLNTSAQYIRQVHTDILAYALGNRNAWVLVGTTESVWNLENSQCWWGLKIPIQPNLAVLRSWSWVKYTLSIKIKHQKYFQALDLEKGATKHRGKQRACLGFSLSAAEITALWKQQVIFWCTWNLQSFSF